ncbi:protein FAM161A-like [Sapajus apella]|uniref:Protein FAM161A-like n=1 Tax=Sapajus apella TaxID=9515 RepID=A0A6J3HYH7_SAPAP|nr:protein FAM161A-like [Sapajus apella]
MAASHQAAKLAASSLQVPVNLITGARVAQYESEDPLQALAAATATSEDEEEEKVAQPAGASADFNTNFSGVDEHAPRSSEDFVNLSGIYHSNEEYFKKLEELKAAHIETMAKLEKMYQDKLNLKEVQPLVIREDSLSDSSRSVSEKNSYHPVSLMTSFSEPDLGQSSSLYVSCTCNPPVPTASSRKREQAIRRSLEEKKMLEEERNRMLTKQKQRMKELQKLLTTRAKAYDSHQSLAQISKCRVKYLRKSEKERMREYRRELEEREEKLKKRPLLFERVAQKNARMAAEKHYSVTLKALGISDEFVSKKGQSGKVLEYFNNQETKSVTEDKESFNEEEKIEERENGEENYFIDTNSQDSYKEKGEADEESGEEKSVEESH